MNQQVIDQNSVVDDDEVNAESAFQEKLADALTPGICIEFDPNEATKAGVFF